MSRSAAPVGSAPATLTKIPQHVCDERCDPVPLGAVTGDAAIMAAAADNKELVDDAYAKKAAAELTRD
ncbi:MAG: hypothetical protein ACYCSF_10015 [Acidimicrobiales bacterium]